jgi:sugar phosphate isomerase/epimerase
MTTRRQFLQWTGGGAAAALTLGSSLAGSGATAGLSSSAENTVGQANRGTPAKDIATGQRAAKPHGEQTFALGLASYSLRNLPLGQALAITNRLGLKHICLNPAHLPVASTPAHIAEVAARVKAAGIDLYGAGVIYMRKPADVDRAFEYARAAGIRIMVAAPSPGVLPLVDEKVKKYDLRVAIHNHGPGDKSYPTPQAVYEKIKNLDRRIGLCIDIDHTTRAGVDPSRAAEQFADRLLDVHMRDVTAATPKGEPIEAGHGVIDIPKFLRTLERIRYAGVVAFEFEKDPADPVPGLAESVGYVRGALAALAFSFASG